MKTVFLMILAFAVGAVCGVLGNARIAGNGAKANWNAAIGFCRSQSLIHAQAEAENVYKQQFPEIAEWELNKLLKTLPELNTPTNDVFFSSKEQRALAFFLAHARWRRSNKRRIRPPLRRKSRRCSRDVESHRHRYSARRRRARFPRARQVR